MKKELSRLIHYVATLGGGLALGVPSTTKAPIVPFAQVVVSGAGVLALLLTATTSWFSNGAKTVLLHDLNSVILIAVGVGLLASSHFIHRSSSRIAALEEQIAALQAKKG